VAPPEAGSAVSRCSVTNVAMQSRHVGRFPRGVYARDNQLWTGCAAASRVRSPKEEHLTVPIVAMAASAGGLEAVSELLAALRAGCGMACRPEAPPRWGEHWGRDWDRASAPAPGASACSSSFQE